MSYTHLFQLSSYPQPLNFDGKKFEHDISFILILRVIIHMERLYNIISSNEWQQQQKNNTDTHLWTQHKKKNPNE
jgi:hypothetical protein